MHNLTMESHYCIPGSKANSFATNDLIFDYTNRNYIADTNQVSGFLNTPFQYLCLKLIFPYFFDEEDALKLLEQLR